MIPYRPKAETRRLHSELESMQAKVSPLPPREREVLAHVVAGRLNKQMEKLGIRMVADLVRMAEKLNLSK
jgi:FixJ family two-component response regulator